MSKQTITFEADPNIRVYDMSTHLAIQKPVWYVFGKDPLPDAWSEIYVCDTMNHPGCYFLENFVEQVHYSGLTQYRCDESTYSSYCIWTYANSEAHPDGLDLSKLLPIL